MSAQDNNSSNNEKTEESDPSKLQVDALRGLALDKKTKKLLEEDPSRAHAFWDSQPVPKLGEKIETTEKPGPIEPIRTIEEVRKEAYNLPGGFEWCETDLGDSQILSEVYVLLNENYVEDDDNMFRFDYSKEFLLWAMSPPGYLKTWHIGVRVSKTKKLVGFISAIPATVNVYSDVLKLVEINYLCVHKKLRDKRLAPVLIKEITRRVNLTGIFQAVYTAGKVLPKPVSRCRYYHRSLNPKKLIEVGFSYLGNLMTMSRAVKLYKLPDKPAHVFKPLTPELCASACSLLNKYLQQFQMHPEFDLAEFKYWFLPRPGVVSTFVCLKPGEGNANENSNTNSVEVTDMLSYYSLPSTIIGNPKYHTLRAAYSFYNVFTSMPVTKGIQDALVFAKSEGFDVYNCLDLMENEKVLTELKFGRGDGSLQYYLYNWRCAEMKTQDVGLVLF